MLSLTYVSSSSELLDETRLQLLLADIRPKNERLGLTGMLLYSDGNIIQTIEGPDEAVEDTFATIEADPRHRGLLVVLRNPIEERAFPHWSMGFHTVALSEVHGLPGYTGFLGDPSLTAGYAGSAAPAYRLLELFRETMR